MTTAAGCSLTGYDATCSYSTWSPPLADAGFSQSPGNLLLNNINGAIPSNALSGLTNSGGYSGSSQFSFDCGVAGGNTITILSDSFSSNLAFVDSMAISYCDNMVVNDGAFASFTTLALISILGGSFSSLSPTAFSGLTKLNTFQMYATMPTTGIPAGLFSGLTELTDIDMSRTQLYSIPSGLFDDQKNLTTLTINECGLTTLPGSLFTPLLSLNSLTIADNPWACTCDMQWLGEYLTETGLGTTLCGSPASLAAYDLTRTVKSLTCTTASESSESTDWWRWGLLGGASLALVLAVIALIACCYQRNQYKSALKSDKAKQAELGGAKQTDAKSNNTTTANNKTTTNSNTSTNSTNSYSNNAYTTTTGVGGDKAANDKLHVWTVSNEHVSRSPFNKRSGKVTPSEVNIKQKSRRPNNTLSYSDDW